MSEFRHLVALHELSDDFHSTDCPRSEKKKKKLETLLFGDLTENEFWNL